MNNYGELKAEIANWLDRTDQTDNIPNFIRLAESKIYRVLRTRENEFLKTWTGADDPFNPIELPQNYRQIELLTLNGAQVRHVSNQEYMRIKNTGYQGDYVVFAIIGRELRIWPWADETLTVEEWAATELSMVYYGSESIGEMATWTTPSNPNSVPESVGTPAQTTMRTDDATTRLLLVCPDVLLYGALAEAYFMLREPAKAGEYRTLMVSILNELNSEHDMAQFSGSTAEVSSVYGEIG